MFSEKHSETDFAHLNALLKSLSLTLEDEYAALKNGEIEKLELLIEQKSELLKNIEGISQRVEPLITAARTAISGGSNLESMPIYVQNVLNELSRCSQKNQINGASIEANRNFCASMLSILTARELTPKTYDASGKFTEKNASALSTQA